MISRPMPPAPTMPTVLPVSGRPWSSARRHVVARAHSARRLAAASSNARTCSATATAYAPAEDVQSRRSSTSPSVNQSSTPAGWSCTHSTSSVRSERRNGSWSADTAA